jgi:hypothetical protein
MADRSCKAIKKKRKAYQAKESYHMKKESRVFSMKVSNFVVDNRSKALMKDIWLKTTFGKFQAKHFSLRTLFKVCVAKGALKTIN